MVRLNKHELSHKQLAVLVAQLHTVLGAADTKQIEGVLSDLLGHEEKIMLAKRLGMIVLFLEGGNANQVATALKVSRATAGQVRSDLASGHHKKLVALLSKDKKNYLAILEAIDSVLHVGGALPHYGQRPKKLIRDALACSID